MNTYNKNIEIIEAINYKIIAYDKTNYFKISGYSEIDEEIRNLFNILNIIMKYDYDLNSNINRNEFYRNNDYSTVTKSYIMNIKNYVLDKVSENKEAISFIEDAL